MSRLIDADLLEKEIYKWMPKDQETWMSSDIPPIESLVVSIMMTIEDEPTVDAAPVRHGRWIKYTGTGKVQWMCSECSAEEKSPKVANWCYHCGAKMDERKQNNDSD